MALICEWARGTGFEWSYCDVVGDRLLEAYRISPIRVRCKILLAALELAVSHNRWHVINQAGAILGIWRAIRDLYPDQRRNASDVACVIAIVVACVVWYWLIFAASK
jgi:hypothetical protein